MSNSEILLDNILFAMETETFGKAKSAKLVGGKKRLMKLIEDGKIRTEKPTNAQNGKWYCIASDVLKHCRIKKRTLSVN